MTEQYKVFKTTQQTIWEVSNHGNIKKNGKPYASYFSGGNGGAGGRYPALTINEPHSGFIHRIVASEFIDNPENKRTVNHKDGNKCNNHVDNLEWATYAENNKHARDTGLIKLNPVIQDLKKQAYELRLTGKGYKEVGDIIGSSPQYARLLVFRYKKEI